MYVKLFSSILDSSIWTEDHATVRVWITVLAMADSHGFVRASVSGLARRANVSLPELQQAIGILEGPDPESGSPEFEGRRMQAQQGGWQILNYLRYRQMFDEDTRREQNREAVARHRSKQAASPVINCNHPSSDVSTSKHESAHTEEEAEAEAKKILKDAADALFDRFWTTYPKRAGSNPRKAARLKWDARIEAGVDPEDIIAGAIRYRDFCKATDKLNTEYVKQAQFWLAPSFEGWTQSWDRPAGSRLDSRLGPSDAPKTGRLLA